MASMKNIWCSDEKKVQNIIVQCKACLPAVKMSSSNLHIHLHCQVQTLENICSKYSAVIKCNQLHYFCIVIRGPR